MNQEIKQKWVESLRSGKYKQGQGYLRKGNNYCCLGVLCDLHGDKEWNPSDHPTKPIYNYGDELRSEYPPAFISEWAAISEKDIETLAYHNDNKEFTFEKIADYIEENL
jgi:hypothetical protein